MRSIFVVSYQRRKFFSIEFFPNYGILHSHRLGCITIAIVQYKTSVCNFGRLNCYPKAFWQKEEHWWIDCFVHAADIQLGWKLLHYKTLLDWQ